MEEGKRSRIWRMTATTSFIIVLIVAAFFVIRIMTDNPTRGIWSSTDSDLTLSINSLRSVTLSWPDSDSLSEMTVKMNSEINRGEQLISFEADEKSARRAIKNARDPDMVRADLSVMSGTFSYEIAGRTMTLTDPDSGDSLTFEKTD